MKLTTRYQRLEALFIFLAALFFFAYFDFNLIWFFLLILAVDVFMLGYLVNEKVGAHLYNIGHSYIIPALLLVCSAFFDVPGLLFLGLIWAAHIGLDRALGFGLKHETGFKDTHLGKL